MEQTEHTLPLAPTLPRRDIERLSREPELEVDASGMEKGCGRAHKGAIPRIGAPG
jgi:hypothetical protein